MTEHDLKCWPEFFQAIVEGRKPFDYRFNDRDYQVDDVLHQREFVPPTSDQMEGAPMLVDSPEYEAFMAQFYTGRAVRHRVTYVLDDKLGPTMKTGFVVMGLGPLYVGPDLEPAPWVPMSDPRDIKVVGKNIEEICEAGAALARALIQGIDGTEPSSGKSNRQWVQDELADVRATSSITTDHFALDTPQMAARVNRKRDFLLRWLGMMAA